MGPQGKAIGDSFSVDLTPPVRLQIAVSGVLACKNAALALTFLQHPVSQRISLKSRH